MKVLISSIQEYSTYDGPGIRTTVFLKGCSCGCLWCQNPEALHDKVETINGVTYGYYMDTDELVDKLLKNTIFFDKSGGGVTFSGGNPLMQINELLTVCAKLKREGIHIALDVYGDCSWEVLYSTLQFTDLYLYDLKVMDPKRHLHYIGVPLQQPLDNLAMLSSIQPNILVRTPIIPGVNDDIQNTLDQIQFMLNANLTDIELFPYHPQAEDKYKRLGWEYKMAGTLPPAKEAFEEIVSLYRNWGFNVKTQ